MAFPTSGKANLNTEELNKAGLPGPDLPWMKDLPTHPPLDMAEFLRSPPPPPSSCDPNTSLWLLGQKLDDHCAEVLAKTLTNGEWRHLTHFSLAHNADITTDGCVTVFNALAKGATPLLQQLNLSGLDIGDAGAAALANAIPTMSALHQIEIVDCNIGEKGGIALMDALKATPLKDLYSIYLNRNAIGDSGLTALCEACEGGNMPALGLLMLSGCSIGDEGCLALANAIEDGHLDQVRTIYLQQTLATKDGFEVIDNVIKEYEKKQPCVYF